MKNLTTLLALLLAGISISAQTINISKEGLLINDVKVSDSKLVSDFIKALGEDYRTIVEPYGKCFIYDEKGIIIQERFKYTTPTDTVASFIIHFTIPTPESTLPDKTFSGSATINKLVLSKTTLYSDLKKNMRGWDEPNTGSKHIHRYTDGKLYLDFWFTKEAEPELKWMSVDFKK